MEKKTECEIVQDLLLNYADDVLNKESKKLVECHLIECEKCKERLSEIKKEMGKNQENQKAQIDYLKKVRLKNKLKSFLGAVFILVAVFVGWYCYQFGVIFKVTRNLERQFAGENFYIETITADMENRVIVNKTWYKDGKYKIERYIENEEAILQTFETCYGNINENAKEEYFVSTEQKKVRKETLLVEKNKHEFVGMQSSFVLKDVPQYWIRKLGEPFFVKISTDHKEIGRKYYVFQFGETEKWVDIETGLPIMSFGETLFTSYYKDTKIPKQNFESITEYRYEFEQVKNEEVEIPDLEGYEWEEFDWGEEMKRLEKEKSDDN